jgi:hypothetical protein
LSNLQSVQSAYSLSTAGSSAEVRNEWNSKFFGQLPLLLAKGRLDFMYVIRTTQKAFPLKVCFLSDSSEERWVGRPVLLAL